MSASDGGNVHMGAVEDRTVLVLTSVTQPHDGSGSWAVHDEMADELIHEHGGISVPRSDGVLGVFEDASTALRFAVLYRDALATTRPPLAPRIAVHRGAVTLHPSPQAHVDRGAPPLQVDGLAIAIAARVVAIARDGQILATARPPGGAHVHHGHWRMKGALAPVEVYEVSPQGSPQPPDDGEKATRVAWNADHWVPVREVPHTLPAEWDTFVGRSRDLHTLATILDEGSRLVTVTGIGGCGKTRLTTRFGWQHRARHPGGVWFCDVSEARDLQGIVAAVADSLGLRLDGPDPVTRIGHALAGRGRCLLLLDNFEQVADHAEPTVGRWLHDAPQVTVVVTSRQVLGLPSEQALPLPPLESADAVDLFVDRASAAKRDFQLRPEARPQVEALVQLLDGLPLAIELAAARSRVLSPNALLKRMSERFRVLTSSGTRVDRQATLRATLDWSWALLSEDEQDTLAGLSCFEGGFSRESVARVSPDGPRRSTTILDRLVDKSLVRRVGADRFDLLVTVQSYAFDKLEETGQRTPTESRHGAWFATLGTDEALQSGGDAAVRDLDNVVVACRRAVRRSDGPVAVSTLRAAWSVLGLRGPLATAVDLAQHVLSLPSLPQEGHVHQILGAALDALGRTDEASRHLQRALAHHRRERNAAAEGHTLVALGTLARSQGRHHDAETHLTDAIARFTEASDPRGAAWARHHVGVLRSHQGRLDEALPHFEHALSMLGATEDRRAESHVQSNLGYLHFVQGRWSEALELYDAALAAHRAHSDRSAEAVMQLNLGNLHVHRGSLQQARECYEAGATLARRLGDRRTLGRLVTNLGLLHKKEGRLDDAAATYTTALKLLRELGDRRTEAVVLVNVGTLQEGMGQHTTACETLARAVVLLRAVGDRRLQAMALVSLGGALGTLDHRSQARACWDAALPLLDGTSDAHARITLHTTRARHEASWDGAAARSHLARAETLASQVDGGDEGEIQALLSRAREEVACRTPSS